MIVTAPSIIRDRRAATIVEFAIVLLPLLCVIFGLLELGYQVYLKSVTAGALESAVRDVSIGNKTSKDIEDRVKSDLGPLVDSQYVAVQVRSFKSFSAVSSAERLTDDKNGNGQYDPGDCFRDENDNGRYDTASTAGRDNFGGAEDVVSYTINISYPHLFPVSALFGWSSRGTVSANAVVRNQPYAKAGTAGIVCA